MNNCCYTLNINPCSACAMWQGNMCWVYYFANDIEVRGVKRSFMENALVKDYTFYFREAVRCLYPEHIGTVEKMLLLL